MSSVVSVFIVDFLISTLPYGIHNNMQAFTNIFSWIHKWLTQLSYLSVFGFCVFGAPSYGIEISGILMNSLEEPVEGVVFINGELEVLAGVDGRFSGEIPVGQVSIYAESNTGNENQKSLIDSFYAGVDTEVRLRVKPLRTVTITTELPLQASGPWLSIFEAVTPGTQISSTDLQVLQMTTLPSGQSSYTKNFELPDGIYRAQVRARWPNHEDGAYVAWIGFEVTELQNRFVITEEDRYSTYPIKERPVDSAMVIFEKDNLNGYLKVIGSENAAMPAMALTILNLQTGHYTWGSSRGDGSFELLINGQEGSEFAIYQRGMVDGWQNFQLGVGTNLRVPYEIDSKDRFSTEHSLSAFNSSPTNKAQANLLGGKTAGIAQFSGAFDFSVLGAGSTGEFSGSVQVVSPSLPDLSLEWGSSELYIEKIVDGSGWVVAASPENSSNFMTVSGLPINGEPFVNDTRVGTVTYSEIENVSPTTARAKFTASYDIPAALSDGRYQIHLRSGSLKSDVSTTITFTHNFALDASTSVLDGRVGEFEIGAAQSSKIDIALLANDYSNGSRGAVPDERKNNFGITPGVIFNSHQFVIDGSVPFKSERTFHNLEPFVPIVSWTTKGHQVPLPIKFKFPSGQLLVTVTDPEGQVSTLGPAVFKGTYLNEPYANWGTIGGNGGAAPQQYLKLTTLSDQFNYTFDKYGEYKITVEGSVLDVEDRIYSLGGDFKIVRANPLDLEFGMMPGTPFEVGDHFAPQLIIQPGVPAEVKITLSHYPNSDPTLVETTTFEGFANRFGYYDGGASSFVFSKPGEYRVDVYAQHFDTKETLWAGSRTWGGIVETPETQLEMRGVKGTEGFPNYRQWFNFDTRPLGIGESNTHVGPSYLTGDISWMHAEDLDRSNSAMTGFYTIFDKEGAFRDSVKNRLSEYSGLDLMNTGMPFVSTTDLKTASGSSINPFFELKNSNDHWSYYYNASERPGVAAREHIGQLSTRDNYWRFSDTYNYQLGNGQQGDNPNDFKFIFGGGVYRVPQLNESHYLAYGSLWVHLPRDDQVGGRIMPPFQGASAGPSGGPILTLLGRDVDIFYHPLGVRPGSVLEVGDVAAFSGQIAPTLPSEVSLKVVSPSGKIQLIQGTASKVGYFYDPASNFIVAEAGVYNVEITVTHQGMTSAGMVEAPFPTGGILSRSRNSFQFYAVERASKSAKLFADLPAVLPDSTELKFDFKNSDGTNSNLFYQTTVMPGYVLEQSSSNTASYIYNAKELNKLFPNLDVDDGQKAFTRNADTITYSFLLKSEDDLGNAVYEANQILLQGRDIFRPDHEFALGGEINILMEDVSLSAGELLKVDLSLDAKGIGDLYVALIMPDGNFVTLGDQRLVSNVGEIIPFKRAINFRDKSQLPVIELSLPPGLLAGKYSFAAILVPEGISIYEEKKWKGISSVPWTFN